MTLAAMSTCSRVPPTSRLLVRASSITEPFLDKSFVTTPAIPELDEEPEEEDDDGSEPELDEEDEEVEDIKSLFSLLIAELETEAYLK